MPTSFSDDWLLATPAGLAHSLSDGRWVAAPHLQLLSERLVELATRRITRLVVEMPPQHGKSELVSHWFPVWYLDTYPSHKVLLASYGADYAAEWGARVRDSILGGYRGLGVRLCGKAPAANRLRTLAGGAMSTAGVGGPLTGKGAHLLIVDDPIKNDEEAQSQTYRDKVWRWWTSTAYTRLAPDGVAVVVMTRWHEDDLVGRLVRAMEEGEGERWEVLRLPAVAEEDDPLGRAPGEALWPERYSREHLDAIKIAVGSRVWSALYQQRPSPEQGQVFLRDWWRRYGAPPARFDSMLQSWDCAFKDLSTSDFVVGQVWGKTGPNAYLLDQVRGRMGFAATVQAVQDLRAKWPQAIRILIEDKANGPAVIETLQKKIPGVVAVEPEGGKVARAQAVSPYLEAGNVWLPEQAPWVGDFIEEATSFPAGRHDDQVDACTQALLRLFGGGGTVTVRPGKRIITDYRSRLNA